MSVQSPILDYRDGARDKVSVTELFRKHLSVCRVAVTIVAVCAGIGLILGKPGPDGTDLLIFPIYCSGLLYVAGRILRSRTNDFLKALKILSGVFALALAPFVFCRYPSIFKLADAYGWTSKEALVNLRC